MFTFAKFAKAIRKAMSISSDEELVNVLLGCIYEPFINNLISDKSKQEKFYIKKEYASRLMSGAYDVHLEIQAGSGDPTVIAGAKEYFQEKVIDKYNKPSMVDDWLTVYILAHGSRNRFKIDFFKLITQLILDGR